MDQSILDIKLKSQANKLKELFLTSFLERTISAYTDLIIEGSHHNEYQMTSFMNLHFYTNSALKNYAGLIQKKTPPKFSNEFNLLISEKIYYENISKKEFTNIIHIVRDNFFRFGIYIDIEIVNKIIELYNNNSYFSNNEIFKNEIK